MSTPPNILVFDSGAGGLSVAKEILNQVAHCHLIYLADNAYFPYGDLEDGELLERILSVITSAIAKHSPHIVVIACNTASTLALQQLRQQNQHVSFVGVVPAVKPAAQISQSGNIGVLATPATIGRNYTKNLISDHASEQQVFLHGSTNLVKLAEMHLAGEPVSPSEIESELDQLLKVDKSDNIDTVVLACTHFPLLKQHFIESQITKQKKLKFVDSGEAIGRRIKFLLENQFSHTNNSNPEKNHSVVFEYTSPSNSLENQKHYKNYLLK